MRTRGTAMVSSLIFSILLLATIASFALPIACLIYGKQHEQQQTQ